MDFFDTQKVYLIASNPETITFKIPQAENCIYSLDLLLRRSTEAFAYHSYKVIHINTVSSTALASIGDKVHIENSGVEVTMAVSISTTTNDGKIVSIVCTAAVGSYLTIGFKRIMNNA